VAGIPSILFFGGALLASVPWLLWAFCFLFFLGRLAGFGMLIGAGGTGLGLAGRGGRTTLQALLLDTKVCLCRLLFRCLNWVFSLACRVPKYCCC
jgi:hypothetical protein